jgi:hypothetical protein
MDLGTVTTKLHTDEYAKEDEFCADVLLTFNNATKYNPPEHPIHLIAVTLKKRFRDNWGKARPESSIHDTLDSRDLNGDVECFVCVFLCACCLCLVYACLLTDRMRN